MNPFSCYWRWTDRDMPAGGWVRVFGYGVSVMLDRPVLFSERYGYKKILRVGRLSFMWLKP